MWVEYRNDCPDTSHHPRQSAEGATGGDAAQRPLDLEADAEGADLADGR